MKLWFKIQFWAVLIALVYIFFIFNDGYLGGLLLDVLFGLMFEGFKAIGQKIIETIVDSALHQ